MSRRRRQKEGWKYYYFIAIIYYCKCVVWFNIVGVIYLTTVIDQLHFPSGQFSLQVNATDGGHPPLSTVAMLRVMMQDVAATVNETESSGGIGRLLRSALASDRLATVLAVLLAAVVFTIAVILLFAVVIDRRRGRLPGKLADCRCLPMCWRHRKMDGSVAGVLTMARCCCCCCVDESQHRRKCKPRLSADDATATTEDVSRSMSTVVTHALRPVSALKCLTIKGHREIKTFILIKGVRKTEIRLEFGYKKFEPNPNRPKM